jgi:hypothetical protein
LHARATQGEWAHVLRGSRPVGHIRVPDGPFVFERGFGARIAADADLIVAMHRHLPALIALARAAEEVHSTEEALSACLAPPKSERDHDLMCRLTKQSVEAWATLGASLLPLTSTPTEATAGEG